MVELLSRRDGVVNDPMMAQEVGGGVSEVGSIGGEVSVGEKCRMADGGVVGNGGGLGLGDLPRSGLLSLR
jgi:hypothetical protein